MTKTDVDLRHLPNDGIPVGEFEGKGVVTGPLFGAAVVTGALVGDVVIGALVGAFVVTGIVVGISPFSAALNISFIVFINGYSLPPHVALKSSRGNAHTMAPPKPPGMMKFFTFGLNTRIKNSIQTQLLVPVFKSGRKVECK